MEQVATVDFQMILLQNYMHVKIQTQMEIKLTFTLSDEISFRHLSWIIKLLWSIR